MKKIFFLITMLLPPTMSGCAYQSQSRDPLTPVTYEASLSRRADSIGKLRRLALMPVEMVSYEGRYASAKDREAAALNLQDACAAYLAVKKGYEITTVREAEGNWRSGLPAGEGAGNIREFYGTWREERGGGHSASLIQEIGRALGVDGLLVVGTRERKPWGVMEGLLNIAFMNVPLFYNIVSPNIGAWIYETSSGRLVWRREYSSDFDSPDAAAAREGTDTADIAVPNRLFADLENAVPPQLIEPDATGGRAK